MSNSGASSYISAGPTISNYSLQNGVVTTLADMLWGRTTETPSGIASLYAITHGFVTAAVELIMVDIILTSLRLCGEARLCE